jgi:hypothetical protein
VVHAVELLAGHAERARSAHRAELDRQPLLDRAGEGPQAVVGELLAAVGDRPVVEQRAHHLERLDRARQRLHPLEAHAVLGEERLVAEADDRLGTAAGQLIERAEHLNDERGIPQDDVRHVRAEADLLRLARRGREQQPHVLPPRLVDRVGRVVAQLVGGLDQVDRLLERVRRQMHVAELHHRAPPAGTRNPHDVTRSWAVRPSCHRGQRLPGRPDDRRVAIVSV